MDEVHARIISILSGQEKSLMIKEISQRSGLHPQTVARNLDVLEVLGRVRKIQIGHAKKYYLTDTIPVSSLIDLSSDLILILNKTHQIQYINNAAVKFLHLNSPPIIGERLDFLNLDLFSSPLILEGLKQYTQDKVFRTNLSYHHEGSLLWYSISIISLALKTNDISIAIIAEDITAEKKAEDSLKEKEKKFRLISENIGDVVWLYDRPSKKLIYISPSVYQLIGYTPEELLLLPEIEKCTTESSIQLILNTYQELSPHAECQKSLVRLLRVNHIHKNGSIIPVEMVMTLLPDSDEVVARILCVTRNISERIQIEEKLKKSQEHVTVLAGILERSSQPFVLADSEGKLSFWNRAFEDLIGYSHDEIRDIDWIHDLTPPEYIIQEQEILADLQSPDQSVRYEKEYLRRDGTRVPVELNTHLLMNQDNFQSRYYSFITNISEKKLSETKEKPYLIYPEISLQDKTDTTPIIINETGKADRRSRMGTSKLKDNSRVLRDEL